MLQNELMATAKDGKTQLGINVGYGVAWIDNKTDPESPGIRPLGQKCQRSAGITQDWQRQHRQGFE